MLGDTGLPDEGACSWLSVVCGRGEWLYYARISFFLPSANIHTCMHNLASLTWNNDHRAERGGEDPAGHGAGGL